MHGRIFTQWSLHYSPYPTNYGSLFIKISIKIYIIIWVNWYLISLKLKWRKVWYYTFFTCLLNDLYKISTIEVSRCWCAQQYGKEQIFFRDNYSIRSTSFGSLRLATADLHGNWLFEYFSFIRLPVWDWWNTRCNWWIY
jgi:hypothetical protein